ncbi:MAG: ABC transporter permease [Flavobacteriales bacterium]
MLWLRLLRESFLFAWTAILANKLRTFLSLLGVMVGIFMISAVFAVVDSLEDNLKSTFNMLDEDVLFVQKWPWAFGDDYPWWKYMSRREPSLSDMESLSERLTLAEAVAYQTGGMVTLEAGNNVMQSAQFGAVTHDYNRAVTLDIDAGRYFSELESQAGRPVAIIGHEVAMNLFGRHDAVGQRFEIKGLRCDVIGVFSQQGASVVSDGMDQLVLAPVGFGQRVINLENSDGSILVKAAPDVSLDALKDQIVQFLRPIRRLRPMEESDFSINQMDMVTGIIDGIFDQVELGGWFIAIFAILVGCFSVANIMFVSVRERTRIIGVQKAIGAKRTFILTQFLFEAVALCVFGAVFALLAIEALVLGVNALDLGFVLGIRPSRILVALSVAVASGLIAGMAPASAAARMAPVEAMRR